MKQQKEKFSANKQDKYHHTKIDESERGTSDNNYFHDVSLK